MSSLVQLAPEVFLSAGVASPKGNRSRVPHGTLKKGALFVCLVGSTYRQHGYVLRGFRYPQISKVVPGGKLPPRTHRHHLDFDAYFGIGINRLPLESLACDLTLFRGVMLYVYSHTCV